MGMTVPALNFSTPRTVDGVTTLGVNSNGIDFQKLIDVLVDSKKLPLIDEQKRLDLITAKLEALATLELNTQALYSSAQALQNPLTVPGTTTVFNEKIASVQSSSAVPASQIVGIVSDSSATAGNYTLMVNQVATNDTISSTVGETSSSVAMGGVGAGNLIINGQAIPIGATPTLEAVVSGINNYSSLSNVVASVIMVNATDYRLNLICENTGEPITLTDDQGGVLLTSLNIAPSGETVNSLSAQLIYNNLTIYRTTNQVDDLIPGLNIQLINSAPATTLNVTVEHDLVGILTAITDFVTAYNTYNDFVASQKVVNPSTGQVGEGSVLFNDPVLRMVSLSTTTTISSSATGVAYGGGLTNLSAIGITLDPANHNNLLIDATTLNNGLINNLTSVIQIFGFYLTQSNTSINATDIPTSLDDALIDSSTNLAKTFTVEYSLDMASVPSATLTLGALTVSADMNGNGTFSGPTGSVFDGFSFAYDGAALAPGGSISTNFTASQGVADKMVNQLAVYLDPATGSFLKENTQFIQNQEDIQDRIDAINAKVDKERIRLTALYAKVADSYSLMEQQLSQIKNFSDALYGSK
jgi:flagellar hook-associated protein 2